jgi:capsular polysaccharide biosynthesis protein
MATSGRTEGPITHPRWADETLDVDRAPREWSSSRLLSLRNLLIAALLGVIAGIGGGFVAMKQTPVYRGQAQLLIDQPRALALSPDDGPILKLDLLKIKYANLANTPAIAGPAAAALGLPESVVADAVTATPTPQSFLVTVDANASTRARARAIANTVAQSISTYADQEQARIGVAPENRYGFSTVHRATTSKAQPTVSRAIKAAAVLAVVVFVGAYVILQLLSAQPR